MTRRGQDAKARARRHRATVTIRSRSARKASAAPPPSPAKSDTTNTSSRLPPVAATTPNAEGGTPSKASGAPARPARPRNPPATAVREAVDQLRQLVAQREAAAVVVDRDVSRLRRLGASWPDIAQALGVSRQAARQKYTGRGSK